MDSLVSSIPKIWKLEDKVIGTELGLGKFQFNFEMGEDMYGVLANGPYHFDGWMVVLVKWDPNITRYYPSAITFWVKVTEILLHLWEEVTLTAVGKSIGVLRDVDVDSGSVLVTINGFNTLVFQLVVPFDNGDEVVVSLEYVKLMVFCQHYFRLTHDVTMCHELRGDGVGARGDQVNRCPLQINKANVQGSENKWEKPRKTAKRTLDFGESGYRSGSNSTWVQDQYHSFPWKRKGVSSSGHAYQERQITGVVPTGLVGDVEEFGLMRGDKAFPAWPKPLYLAKGQAGGVQVKAMVSAKDYFGPGPVFYGANVSANSQLGEEDLLDSQEDISTEANTLEDGELVKDKPDLSIEDQEMQENEVNDLTIIDDQVQGVQGGKKKGTQAGAANQTKKKGMMALPKSPAKA